MLLSFLLLLFLLRHGRVADAIDIVVIAVDVAVDIVAAFLYVAVDVVVVLAGAALVAAWSCCWCN